MILEGVIIMGEKIYCVYMHRNKINNKCYIGITKQYPEDRWQNGLGYRINKHFWNAIKTYKWENFEHIIFEEGLTKEEAAKKEILLIALYDTTNPECGYNISTGGECGSAGVKRSDDFKQRLHDVNIGKHLSEETKKKLSQQRKGKKRNIIYSIDARRNISESKKGNKNPNYGKPLTEERKIIISQARSRAVIQLDFDGNFVAEYKSMAEAERKTGVKSSNICTCCQGIYEMAGGFKWMLKTSYENTTK